MKKKQTFTSIFPFILSWCFIIAFALIVVWAIVGKTKDEIKEESIEVGQTWKYQYQGNNPHEKPLILYQKVIGVSGDYVLYVQNGKDTSSNTKSWFIIDSELINK